jgi:hypothetical protein
MLRRIGVSDQDAHFVRPLDTIVVRVSHSEDVFADRADIFVTLKGISIGAETSASRQMREATQLVADLGRVGVDASDVRLEDVYASVATGFLGKASSAECQLKVRCADVEKLPAILQVIAGQKNTKLERIDWGYSADSELQDGGLRDRWLAACLERANAKARLIASSLGVRILGVRRAEETTDMGREAPGSLYQAASRARGTFDLELSEAAGLPSAHSKRMTFGVLVIYRISGAEQPPPA